MAGQEISKEEAVSRHGYRHACHIMLYADTNAKLFGKIPIKHIVLMQMRFDGLLGFPGVSVSALTMASALPSLSCLSLVNPSEESLESGLSRELGEEIGAAIPVSPEDHLSSCFAPSTPHLITHFYTKKMKEGELREVEKAAVMTAADHGLEVMGMVRVPLYFLKNGGGFPAFLSHSFISNSRSQLLSALGVLGLVSQDDLRAAVARADKMRHSETQ